MATSLVEQAPVAEANSTQVDLNEYDEEQVRLMEERCILVTADDVAYGEESKKTCKYYCGEMVAPCPRAQSLIPSAFIV
jgi:hypothetical protein